MPTIEQEYVETHAQSRARHERAVRSMPNGVAHDGRVLSPFPFYVERADSASKWDVDGHIYLDCWSGHGALILGHNHPAIVAAITEQAKRGLHYSACHELEVRWAELIRSCVPGAEKVRFTMTGTETTALAVRVARVATGRSKVVKFEGHFHGVHDGLVAAVKDPFEIPMSAGVPKATLASTLVARHNDLALVTELLSDPEVAAVILEPAGGRSMTVPTNPAFLRALRELTRERGVVLIFDEVVTGLRMAPGRAPGSRHGPARREAPSRDAAERRGLQPRLGQRLAQRRDDRRRHRPDGRRIRPLARPPPPRKHPALASAPPASEREPGTPRRPVASGRRLAADDVMRTGAAGRRRPGPARSSRRAGSRRGDRA